MSPKFVDKNQKIKEITLAALTLFSQKGYTAASVEQIAEAAGIGKGTIYEYFDTKEDLFIAAVLEWTSNEKNKIIGVMKDVDDPVKRIMAYVENNYEVFDSTRSDHTRLYIEIIQQTLMEGGVFFKRQHLIKEILSDFFQLLVDILLDGISKGVFKAEIARDADNIAKNLMAFLDGVGLHIVALNQLDEYKAQIDYYMQQLIQSILKEPIDIETIQLSPVKTNNNNNNNNDNGNGK